MIFDELVVTINALDNLKKKTDLKNNKALQDNTDAKYRLLLSQTNSYISTIEYVYTNVPYAKNVEILTATLELLDNLEKVIESACALLQQTGFRYLATYEKRKPELNRL